MRPVRAAGGALLLSYLIEGLQYVHVLRWLGGPPSPLLLLVLGSSFGWGDLLAYTLGALTALGLERAFGARHPPMAASQAVVTP